jgi:hypothetical protein
VIVFLFVCAFVAFVFFVFFSSSSIHVGGLSGGYFGNVASDAVGLLTIAREQTHAGGERLAFLCGLPKPGKTFVNLTLTLRQSAWHSRCVRVPRTLQFLGISYYSGVVRVCFWNVTDDARA